VTAPVAGPLTRTRARSRAGFAAPVAAPPGRLAAPGPWLTRLPLALVVVAGQLAVGVAIGTGSRLGVLAAVGAAAAVVALRWPQAVLLAALPANLAYWRVGGSGIDLSLADAVITAGAIAALPHVPWRSAVLHRVQRLYAVYAALLAIAVAVHPTRTALISFSQRAVMVLGAVAIGAAIGARGHARAAARVLYAVACGIAVAAVIDCLQRDLQPAYPFGMHKNLVGAFLSLTLVLSFAAPRVAGLAPGLRWAAQAVMIAGLGAAQARGATLSVVAALAVAAIRSPRLLRSPLVIGAVIGATALSWVAFQRIDEDRSNRFGSVNSRVATYEAAIDLWHEQPLVGVGIKYWRDPELADRVGFGEPHSVFISALGETGVVGLAALITLLAGSGVIAWRRRSPWWSAFVLLLTARMVDAQLGIFWVANSGSFIWVVLGIAIGEETRWRGAVEGAVEGAAGDPPA
jgi:O-antigen ligase